MTRGEKLIKLHYWMKFYWIKVAVLFLFVAFLIKGIPATGIYLLVFLMGSCIFFLFRYEAKRTELGLNTDNNN